MAYGVALSPQEEAFLREQRVARLATADAQGRPSLVPVCFVYLDGVVYTAVDEKPKLALSDAEGSGQRLRRLRNIEENPRVALLFDRYEDDWERLGWVLLRGRASLVSEAAERARALAALREKYRQYQSMALEERPLIRVEPEQASSWGAVGG